MLLIMVTCVAACGEKATKDYYEIEGRVTGVEDGAVLTLFRITGEPGPAIDHDTLTNGKFYFRVKPIQKREHLTVLCWHDDFPSMPIHLWAEAGDRVRITGDDELIYTWQVKGGAPENGVWQGYVRCAEETYDALQRVMIEENHIRIKGQEPDADQAALQAEYDRLGGEQIRLMTDIHGHLAEHMKRCEVDAIGLIHLEEMAAMCKYFPEYPHREAVEAIYNSLDDELRNDPAVQRIGAYLYPVKQVAVGEPMVDGLLYDLEGNSHTLAELSGKYILLDMWSSGCGPCVMSIPEMAEVAERYAEVLEVVSITTDTDKMWREASAKHPITWHNWSDGNGNSGIYAHYDQSGIPSYTLISPDGIVIDRWKGYGNGSLRLKLAENLE